MNESRIIFFDFAHQLLHQICNPSQVLEVLAEIRKDSLPVFETTLLKYAKPTL